MARPESGLAAASRVGKNGGLKKSATGIYVYIEGHPYKVSELATMAGVSRKTIEARIKEARDAKRPLAIDDIVKGGQERGRWK